MKVQTTALPGVLLLQPMVHRDARGFFMESFQQQAFEQATGCTAPLVQDNHSRSHQGVLRGLHYQVPPQAQGKLVRVLQGEIWDVAVDIRQASPTFGQWLGVHLKAENAQQLWIPPGFAHGFVVLSAYADVFYKTTAYYAPELDRGIAWNDPDLAIQWPDVGMDFLLSDKDQKQPAFKKAEVFVPPQG